MGVYVRLTTVTLQNLAVYMRMRCNKYLVLVDINVLEAIKMFLFAVLSCFTVKQFSFFLPLGLIFGQLRYFFRKCFFFCLSKTIWNLKAETENIWFTSLSICRNPNVFRNLTEVDHGESVCRLNNFEIRFRNTAVCPPKRIKSLIRNFRLFWNSLKHFIAINVR